MRAIRQIGELKKESVIYTTTINTYELLRGIYLLPKGREKYAEALRTLVSNLHILDINLEASEKAALIYAELRKKGIEIDGPDYLIAGACLVNGISVLVTRNEKHFSKIGGLDVRTY